MSILKLFNLNDFKIKWRHLYIKLYSRFNLLKVSLASSTFCQLKCDLCDVGIHNKKDNILNSGYLKVTNFKQFIRLNPGIKHIELSGWGEPLLNPEFIKILKLGYKNKLILSLNNGSNFNAVSEEVLEGFVKYGLSSITIGIDGVDEDVYSIYRKGGCFSKVIGNIVKLNNYKMKYNSAYPKLVWQFILFEHNKHQVKDAKIMARKLNMDFYLKLNSLDIYEKVNLTDQLKHDIGIAAGNRSDYFKSQKKPFSIPCNQFFNFPHINFNGDLMGCCNNRSLSYGNVFKYNLAKLMKSTEYQSILSALKGKGNFKPNSPCFSCSVYNNYKKK